MSKTRENLKALMAAADHTIPKLSRKSGVPPQTINRFLSGYHDAPAPATIEKWAAVYGVTASQLRGDVPIEGIEAPPPNVLTHEQQTILDVMMNLEEPAQYYLLSLAQLLAKDPPDRRVTPPVNVEETGEQRSGEKNYREKASGGKYRPSIKTDLFPELPVRPPRKVATL